MNNEHVLTVDQTNESKSLYFVSLRDDLGAGIKICLVVRDVGVPFTEPVIFVKVGSVLCETRHKHDQKDWPNDFQISTIGGPLCLQNSYRFQFTSEKEKKKQ